MLSQVSLTEAAKWLRLQFCDVMWSSRLSPTLSVNTQSLTNVSAVRICSPWSASVSWKHHISCWEDLSQRWHDLAADRDIIYGYSKSKMRRVDVAFSVLPCPFHTSSPRPSHGTYVQSQNLSLTEIDVWCYPAGIWSTWHCKHSHPAASCCPGSAFTCGHRNVNSLSLSISKKDYTGRHLC